MKRRLAGRSPGALMLAAAAWTIAAGPALAADPAAGRVLARQCSVCHGKLGIANDPEVPNLAAQSAYYLEKSLNDYRTGAREDRRMTIIAQALEPAAIKDLAAWYESLVVEVSAPAE